MDNHQGHFGAPQNMDFGSSGNFDNINNNDSNNGNHDNSNEANFNSISSPLNGSAQVKREFPEGQNANDIKRIKIDNNTQAQAQAPQQIPLQQQQQQQQFQSLQETVSGAALPLAGLLGQLSVYPGSQSHLGSALPAGLSQNKTDTGVSPNKASNTNISNEASKDNNNQSKGEGNSGKNTSIGIVLPQQPSPAPATPLLTTQAITAKSAKGEGKGVLKSKSKESGGAGGPLSPTDPDAMADALYGTGVDLKEEESLLHRESEKHKNKIGSGATASGSGATSSAAKKQEVPLAPMFLRSQVFGYAKQQINAHGLKVPQGQEKQLADFLSVACEEFMNPILKDMVVYSRHRRRTVKSSNGIRSDVSKALRDYAAKQKELEEKRVQKKIQLGLEVEDGKAKPKAEELSHRAANATAALMTSGRTKTYSWMTGGGGAMGGGISSMGGGSSGGGSGGARGSDGAETKGVRYREARQEELFSVRDFVRALENRRRGVDKTLVKSYSKLKDMYR